MGKKIFKCDEIKEFFYRLIGEYWLDDDTYVLVLADMVDEDGDVYNIDVEWHNDEQRVTYTKVYEFETMDGTDCVSDCFKKVIEEYLMKQVNK